MLLYVLQAPSNGLSYAISHLFHFKFPNRCTLVIHIRTLTDTYLSSTSRQIRYFITMVMILMYANDVFLFTSLSQFGVILLWLLYTGILRQDESLEELILPELPKNSSVISEVEGKAALIWILGEYGEVRKTTIIEFMI